MSYIFFLGGQMRMPLGHQGPLFPPRGFPSTPLDLESNMVNWRDSFINKYQDTIRDVSTFMIHPDINIHCASHFKIGSTLCRSALAFGFTLLISVYLLLALDMYILELKSHLDVFSSIKCRFFCIYYFILFLGLHVHKPQYKKLYFNLMDFL